MNEIKIFDNPEFGRVRVIYELVDVDKYEPWLVAADVCRFFGIRNHGNIVSRLDDDEKGIRDVETTQGKQSMVVVNESGLYHMLFTMNPQNARGVPSEEIQERQEKLRRFKHWVTSEVLPSIRKNGGYISNQESMSDEDLMARAYVVAQRVLADRERRLALANETIAIQNQQILEMQPKVSYYDIVLQCQDLVSIRQIAKDFGMSAQDMNKRLCDLGIQFKQNKTYLLYQPYAQQGYAQSRTYAYYDNYGRKHGNMHTEWTQKGRLFIYDLMKKQGVLPVCERNNAWQ